MLSFFFSFFVRKISLSLCKACMLIFNNLTKKKGGTDIIRKKKTPSCSCCSTPLQLDLLASWKTCFSVTIHMVVLERDLQSKIQLGYEEKRSYENLIN